MRVFLCLLAAVLAIGGASLAAAVDPDPGDIWISDQDIPTPSPTPLTPLTDVTTELLSAIEPAPAESIQTISRNELVPTSMAIPAVRVDAPVVVLGVSEDGIMDVPSNAYDVAWYDYSALPGQPGNAVFAGHRDWNGSLGSFWYLPRLSEGDEILIYDGTGAIYRYVVEWSRLFGDEDAPVAEILGPTGDATLTLVTCEGFFDYANRNYVERRVVRARLAA